MGTRATLVVATADRGAGLRQLEQMLRVLENTERALSTWRDESLLSQMNRHPLGRPWHAPPRICELLAQTAGWRDETAGAFDPVVGVPVEAWMAAAQAPSNRLVQPSKAAGFEHLIFERDTCTVTRLENVTLDPGGFGKGEALDRISRQLAGTAAAPWMVDLGGQVLVSGVSSTGTWPVAIAHPLDREQTVVELQLRDGSLAVSGGSERDRWVGGVRVGHIVDPRSGLPVAREDSVVVWHREAFVADVLSTALYVMGQEAGLSWAEARDVAVCFVSPSDRWRAPDPVTFRASSTFRRRFALP